MVRFPYVANELYSMGQWARLARRRIHAYMRHLAGGSNSTEHRSMRWREVRRCACIADGRCRGAHVQRRPDTCRCGDGRHADCAKAVAAQAASVVRRFVTHRAEDTISRAGAANRVRR